MSDRLEMLREVVNGDSLDLLRKAIVTYDNQLARRSAENIVEEGISPLEAFEAMTETVRLVGDAYGRGELWLPDLIGAADAMTGAIPIIEEEMKRKGAKRESFGTVVIGTVYGDIHSIGKTMVGTLLIAQGFTVYDLGVNISAEQFIEAVEKHDADILAMSALLTMTASEQRKVINTLEEKGIRDRVKIMVGGGALTADFAESIGADGYEATAPEAAELAKRLVGK